MIGTHTPVWKRPHPDTDLDGHIHNTQSETLGQPTTACNALLDQPLKCGLAFAISEDTLLSQVTPWLTLASFD